MEGYKHQHIFYLFVKLFQNLKNVVFSLIAVLIPLVKTGNPLLIAGASIGIVVLFGLHSYLQFKNYIYWVKEDGVSIKEGVFKKNEVFIPFDKIHTLDISASFFQRIFDVATLKIDTAGIKATTEGILVINRKEAVKLRDFILDADTEVPEERNNKRKATVLELSLAAITSKGIFIGIAAVLGLYTNLDDLIPDSFKDIIVDTGKSLFARGSVLASIVEVTLTVIIFSTVISTLIYCIRFYGFKVEREEEQIKISYGLLSTKNITIPINRIHSIIIEEGLARKPLGYLSINVESIGYGNEQGETTVLFPILKRKEIAAFLEVLLPEFALTEHIQGVPKSSRNGYLIRGIIAPLIVTLPVTFMFKYGFVVLSTLPAFLYLAYLRYKDAGIAVGEKFITLRYRNIARHTVISPKSGIQTFTKRQNPFQRRRGIVNIMVAIQGEILAKYHEVKGVKEEVFDKLVDWIIK
jgi:putative membrane protein